MGASALQGYTSGQAQKIDSRGGSFDMIPLKQIMEVTKIYLGGIFIASPYMPESRRKTTSKERREIGSYCLEHIKKNGVRRK